MVIDAGVVVALVVPDDRQDSVRGKLVEWLDNGDSLYAPSVPLFETANVLARLVYDGDLDIAEVTDIWPDVNDLGIELHPFDLVESGADIAAITARLRRRNATDSTYVHLAQKLFTTVWTPGGPLARNAAGVGLPVQLIT